MTPRVIILWLVLAFDIVSICQADVGDFATEDFFTGISSGASDTCPGKNLYRYNDFINAATAFSGFGTTGTDVDHKRELAAFFANVAHETDRLCYVEEIEKTDYCDLSNTQYPCTAGKQYYGRGPLQLRWNYNYGAAGDDLGFDGLNHPEIVARDGSISWKTAVWFWMKDSKCHSAITSGQGFRATIKAIDGEECNGGNSNAVDERVNYYTNYCSEFGVDPGSNLSC